MAKLYFRYGTMDSAKSMNLLAVAHNYRKQGKLVEALSRYQEALRLRYEGLDRTVSTIELWSRFSRSN